MTRREHEIVAMRLKGFTMPKIAAKLGISEKTVQAHLYRVYGALNVHNVAQLSLRMRTLWGK